MYGKSFGGSEGVCENRLRRWSIITMRKQSVIDTINTIKTGYRREKRRRINIDVGTVGGKP